MRESVDHGDGATAMVGRAPDTVELYAADGRRLWVPAAEEGAWLAQGFSRAKFDAVAALDDLDPLWDATRACLMNFVNGVLVDGHIDPDDDGDWAAAQRALTELQQGIERLVRGVQLAYPMREGRVRLMVDQDGNEHRVDPGQVDLLREERGYRLKSEQEG